MKDLGQPSFRAKQLYEWLYLHHVGSYDEMTNLPQTLRVQLSADYPLFTPAVIDSQTSQDGTAKYVISYHDGARVETVAIPSSDGRLTVCCSTQAGCAMGCTFCATGKEGFTRNLSAGEIVDQILIAQTRMGERVSNVVVMGQGEPFLNYEQTLNALHILKRRKAFEYRGTAHHAFHLRYPLWYRPPWHRARTVHPCGVAPCGNSAYARQNHAGCCELWTWQA